MKYTKIEFVYVIIFVISIVFIECAAQYCLKNYTESNNVLWFILGVITYGGIAYLLTLSFSYEKIAIVNIMWGGFSALVISLMGYYLYKESLTYTQIAGIIIILIGTWMLHL